MAITGIRSRARQRGQGLTEYVIITALIAIAAIAAVAMFGTTVRSQVGAMANEMGGTDGTTQVKAATTEGKNAAAAATPKKDLGTYQSEVQIK
jgi:Flp pilus assembly pilin Flp